ncbi:mCG1035925, partial [Mus musculus]
VPTLSSCLGVPQWRTVTQTYRIPLSWSFIDQAGIKLKRFTCLCLPSAGIKERNKAVASHPILYSTPKQSVKDKTRASETRTHGRV